jgi:Ca2+:H+ antiporter
LVTGVTQLNSSLLAISVIAVLLPAAFHFSVSGQTPSDPSAGGLSNFMEGVDILHVSHGVCHHVSIVAMKVLTCLLLFI